MTYSCTSWAHQEEDQLSNRVLNILRKTFDRNGTQDVNVTKILGVQQKLQEEMHKRAGPQPAVEQMCNNENGTLVLMVDAPYNIVCDNSKPCLLQDKSCVEADALPAGAECVDRSAASVSRLPLSQMRLYAQCFNGDDEHSSNSAQEIPLPSHHPEDGVPPPPPPGPLAPKPTPLSCAVCNNGTAGGCLNHVTGDCAHFDSTGVCPTDFGPCQPNPCHDIRTPCYNPMSPAQQPVCVSKDKMRCRVLDPSQSVCLAQACPPGHIENVGTQWQEAFYPNSTWYGRGLLDTPLIPPDQVGPNDPQVRLPAGSNVVLPVPLGIEAWRSAPGTSMSTLNAPFQDADTTT